MWQVVLNRHIHGSPLLYDSWILQGDGDDDDDDDDKFNN
jgi:hypothetical protein